MGKNRRRKRIKKFQKRLGKTQPQDERVTTERKIIIDDPFLDTNVETLWKEPPNDEKKRNRLSPDRIGMYTTWDRRCCVTADMDYINAYYEIFRLPPPSFSHAGPRECLHFDPLSHRVGLVTAGGIAPGLNMVIHSIVSRHELYGTPGDNIFGFKDGFRGVERRKFMHLNSKKTRRWIRRGGTMLGTRRERERCDVAAVADTLKELGIKILYVIGGNGSLSAAHDIWKEVKRRGLNTAIVGIPKTMDNDLLWVWKSFGFDTAVGEATRAIEILHEEASSNNRICVLKLFGAKSGFVAANATLAAGDQVDAVLIPEENPINLKKVLHHLTRRVAEHNHAMVVVAEGINVPLDDLKDALKRRFANRKRYDSIEVSDNEPRHLIRAVPARAHEQIYCHRLADLAVDNALAGFTDFVVSWWLTEYVLVPLELATSSAKQVPTGGFFWKEVISATGQPPFRKGKADY